MCYHPLKTKLARTTPLALVLWVCSVVSPPPVWACCDNVFSCAAAVVTSGVTCLIDLAAWRLQLNIDRVIRERETQLQAFNSDLESSAREAKEAIEQHKKKADRAAEDLRRYLEEAKRITGEDKNWINHALQSTALQQPLSGVASATGPKSNFNEFQQRPNTSATLPKTDFNLLKQPPAPGTGSERDGVTVEKGLIWDQGNLRLLLEDTSMETLKQRIEAEQKRGEENYKRTLQEEKRAKIATENSRKATEAAFQHSFLGMIDQLLSALRSALRNPLEAGRLISAYLDLLDGALSAIERDVVPAVEQDGQVKQAVVANVKREADQAQRHAEKAKFILAEMRKGAQFKTVVERRALVSSASAAPPMSEANSNPIVSLKSSSRLLATAKNLRPGLMTIRPDLKRLAAQMQPPDLAPIRTKLATSFDQYFKDKSPAQAQTIRDQLILEARQRYNADQTLLAKIEKLINDEARARGVVADPGPVARPCNAGFVWRLAHASDHVCVIPESHQRVLQENATAASRRNPQGGSYGPNTCLTGFVWREAYEGDVVCVTPAIRQLVKEENALHASRSTDPGQLLRPDTGSVPTKPGSTLNPLLKKQSPSPNSSILQTPKEGVQMGTQIFRPQTTPSQGFGGGTKFLRSRGIEEKYPESPAPDAEKKP